MFQTVSEQEVMKGRTKLHAICSKAEQQYHNQMKNYHTRWKLVLHKQMYQLLVGNTTTLIPTDLINRGNWSRTPGNIPEPRPVLQSGMFSYRTHRTQQTYINKMQCSVLRRSLSIANLKYFLRVLLNYTGVIPALCLNLKNYIES